MKNKFLLIMLIVMVGVIGTANATLPDNVLDVDYLTEELEDAGMKCEEGNVEVKLLKDIKVELAFTQDIICNNCNTNNKISYFIDVPVAYERNKISVIQQDIKGNCSNCKNNLSYTFPGNAIRDIPLESNNFVKHSSGYYVYKDLFKLEELNDLEYIDRVLFQVNLDGLKLIYFNPLEVDLFTEVEYEFVDRSKYPTQKYGITPIFESVVPAGTSRVTILEPNHGQEISVGNGRKLFFVCTEHERCCAKGCMKFVASDGWTTGEAAGNKSGFHLSRYCAQDHACGFFWVITYNVNLINKMGIIENLECLDGLREDDHLFCPLHECNFESCKNPIIGANTADGRIKYPNVYTGSDFESYSIYCADHFCWDNMCTDGYRINSDAVLAHEDEESALAYGLTNRCKDHCNNCTRAGCDNDVRYSIWHKTGLFLCDEHAKEVGIEIEGSEDKLSDLTPEEKEELGDLILDLIERDDKRECEKCGLTTTWVQINGKWYCIKCRTSEDGDEISQESSPGGSGSAGGSGGGSYWPDGGSSTPGTPTEPETTQCIHSNYPVPNTVTFSNRTVTTHVQTWTCTNCNEQQTATYEHTYIDGFCVCGEEQDTEKPAIELISPSNLEEVKNGAEIRIKITDNKGLKSIKYKCFWGENTDTVTKELDGGTLQELLIGTLPAETGKYTFFIQEVVDAAGNKLEDQTYIFEIKNTGSGSTKEDDTTIYEDGIDTEKPKVVLYPISRIDLLEGGKIYIEFSDNVGLDNLKYSLNYPVSTEISGDEQVLSTTWPHEFNGALSQGLEITAIKDYSSIVYLNLEVTDKAGNVANASYTFNVDSLGYVEVECQGDAEICNDIAIEGEAPLLKENYDPDASPFTGDMGILLVDPRSSNIDEKSLFEFILYAKNKLYKTKYSVSIDGKRCINGEEKKFVNGRANEYFKIPISKCLKALDNGTSVNDIKSLQIWINFEDTAGNSENAYFGFTIDSGKVTDIKVDATCEYLFGDKK